MICTNCGREIPDTARFCTFCGTPAAAPVQQPVYEAPVEQPVYEAPVEQPVYEAPVEQPVYEAPVEQPVYEAPVEQPVFEEPAQEPPYPYAESPVQEQPYAGQPPFVPVQVPAEKKKGGGKVLPWIIAGILALLLAAAITVGLIFYKQLTEDRDRLTGENEQLSEEAESAQKDAAALKKSVAEKDAEIAEKDAVIANCDASIAEKDDLLESKDSEIADYQAQLAGSQSGLNDKDGEIADLDAKVFELNEELNALEDENDEMRGQISSLSEQLEEAQGSNEVLQNFHDSIIWNAKSFTLGGDEMYGAYPAVLRVKLGQEAKLTLYENYTDPIIPSLEISGIGVHYTTALKVGDSWNDTLQLTITVDEAGIARMDFGNDIDSRTFSILIIAVEP